MNRRHFIVALGSATTLPLVAFAQDERMRRIGVLVLGNPSPEAFLRDFRDGLHKLGYVEGKNVQLEIRSAGGKASALADAAADLVGLKVDIIMAWQTPSATAAKRATSDIPIVMSAGNPVETGLVASLSRPGGNVTGMDNFGAQLGGKCIELVRDTLLSARRVAILANATDPFTRSFLAEIEKAASTLGIATHPLMQRPGDQFDSAFEEMRKNGADAVIIQPTLLSQAAVELALRHRLPSFSIVRDLPAAGGLMSFSQNVSRQIQELARYVDKILKGSSPANLPVMQPTKFDLVINMRTAKMLGIDVPPSLLARIDEVIE